MPQIHWVLPLECEYLLVFSCVCIPHEQTGPWYVHLEHVDGAELISY